jgi:hypothetical protein
MIRIKGSMALIELDQRRLPPFVRFGSFSEVGDRIREVRSTLRNGHRQPDRPRPKSATKRLMHCSKTLPYALVATDVIHKKQALLESNLIILPKAPSFYFRVVTSAAASEMTATSSVRRKPRCSRSRAAVRIRFT